MRPRASSATDSPCASAVLSTAIPRAPSGTRIRRGDAVPQHADRAEARRQLQKLTRQPGLSRVRHDGVRVGQERGLLFIAQGYQPRVRVARDAGEGLQRRQGGVAKGTISLV